ncbi:MAG: sensor histidine kinase [Actinomycetota bacterium]
MSIRSRLLIATVVLVTVGLIGADAATFGLLRSSLVGRVDDQLREAAREFPRTLFAPSNQESQEGTTRFPDEYVLVLDSSGKVVAGHPIGFGVVDAPPVLPKKLPGAAQASDDGPKIFTTGATGASGRYRVLAAPLANGQGTGVIAISLSNVDATLRKLLLVEGGVSLAVLIAIAGLAWWLVRLGLRPLTEMEAAAADIAAGDLSRRVEPADGTTEVGRLGRALNVMLEKIENAFAQRSASEARLRRFVADASHELRTPLTSIRGYAELFRRGARSHPEDLEKSMKRIEDESARMGILVDELLLLARLDQSPSLERAPVDLTVIATDAAEDARAVQPGRPIDVTFEQPVVVPGDETRLRQVAANLLSNALEHTPPDTPVHVRVGVDAERAVFEVSDEGEGLEAEHAAKVFDRFFRVDPSRARENGGMGLGLSIVAAIVYAHGGDVAVETAPGRGSRFIVWLPMTVAESAEQPSENGGVAAHPATEEAADDGSHDETDEATPESA